MTKKQFVLQAVAFVLAWLALPFLLLFSDACPTGTTEWEGVCAQDLKPEQPTQADDVQPSDEKPPKNHQPAWETGEVHADMGIRTSTVPASENYKAEKDQQ